MRNLCFGGVTIPSGLANFALLSVRVFLGCALVYMGLQKIPPSEGFIQLVAKIGFPMPAFFAFSAGLLEVIGGALLIFGLCTRWGALFVIGVVFTALITVHADDAFKARFLPLLVVFVAFQFLLIGGGRFSVDAKLRGVGPSGEHQ